MKVSVIVPTYNRAHMVTETIDSILNQTFKDFELIVVDNCSSDNTEEVIKSYADKRVRYFKHQNNRIVAVNRNYGISKAQGEYIAFCDDDDLWMPDKLERQLQEFEKDSQIGLVCTNLINFDENGEHGKIVTNELKDSDFTFESLIWRNRIVCSSILVKKKVIDDVGVMDESPEFFTAEDYELWLRIAKKYKVKYISLPLVKYRNHFGAYRKRDIEARERDKVIYRKLLDKGILDLELYQKRINKLNRRIFVLKLLRYKWVIDIVSFLIEIPGIAGRMVTKIVGRAQD